MAPACYLKNAFSIKFIRSVSIIKDLPFFHQTTTAMQRPSSTPVDVLRTGSTALPTTPSKKVPYLRLALGKRPKWHLGKFKSGIQIVSTTISCKSQESLGSVVAIDILMKAI